MKPMQRVISNWRFLSVLSGLFLIAAASFAAGDKEKAKGFFNDGLTASQNGKTDAAILGYQAAISEDPAFIDAYINLGAIYFKKNDFQSALTMYRTATEKDAKNLTALSNLANVEYELKRYAEAEGHLNAAIGISPKDASLYKDLGKVLFAKRNYEETIKAANKCHELGGGDNVTYYIQGKSYQKLEKPAEAIGSFEKSVQLHKKNYNALFALGQVFLSQGKYLNAANYFDQALKASPTKHLAAYNYAVAVESHEPENYIKNIEAWDKFVRLAKTNPKARTELAEAENHLKELREAKKQKDLQ